MRWWLALAFAAVAALTALAVAEVFTQRAEDAFRSRAQELTAGAAVGAAEKIKAALGHGNQATVVAAEARQRNIALFLFDRQGGLVSAARSHGVDASAVPGASTAVRRGLAGHRYLDNLGHGQKIVVALPILGGRAVLVAEGSRPELAAELDIVRTEIVPAALIAIAVGAAVGLAVALLIALRLRRIAGAAHAIADGDFETRLEPRFDDELGDLARTVDRMRGRLSDSFSALQSERDRLGRLLERLHQGVVAVDSELNVTFANSAAAVMLAGHPLESGAPLPEPWPDLSLRSFAANLFADGNRSEETRFSPDTSRSYTIVGLAPAVGSQVAVLVLTDITERERRERAEREFITNAAHELRTPLTAITSAVDALESGAKIEAEQRDRFLAIIGRQSARLARLVRALLVLARAQTKQESLVLEPVELATLLRDVVASFDASGGSEIDVSCPADLAVLGHHDLIEQVVTNLVGNAVKHGNNGRIRISAHSAGRQAVDIEVIDAGPGIGREDQIRVFDRFWEGRDRDEDSFGLGLSIVREAVRALGGLVELTSEPGRGTTVRVRLAAVESGSA